MSIDVLEKIVVDKVNPIEYYNKMVVPIDKKFRPMAEGRSTGICPFHVDTDPSLHVWRGKSGKGQPIFHCFGCGTGGNVVFIHMKLMYQYHRKKLSKKESIEHLAAMFGIELPSVEEMPVQESVFERMRKNLLGGNTVPKGKLTLAEYRKTNRRILRYDLSSKQKASAFNKLDIEIAIEKINSSN